VKPVQLMQWLVRLVCPPGGVCLDPFAGSGTTGIACVLEDFHFIGIERDEGYVAVARGRIDYWAKQPKQLGLEV
jgi:DNA modification methylase